MVTILTLGGGGGGGAAGGGAEVDIWETIAVCRVVTVKNKLNQKNNALLPVLCSFY